MIKAVENIEAEIFVVDNNSTDGSDLFFTDRFPQVKFIWKKENAGFAKANNEALRSATGQKILFLNPDTIVPEGCFEKCLTFFSTQQSIGALGVKMIDGGGCYLPESKRGFPSVFTSFCKISGIIQLFPNSKLLAGYYLGHLPENEINEIDVLPGAFMMVDKSVLDITGSFDEAFFMYAEDIDLSYRIQKAGFKNFYFPATTIIHFKGESTRKKSIQYIRNFYGAMLLFVKKHYGKVTGSLYALMIQMVMALKFGLPDIKKSVPDSSKVLSQNKAFVIGGTETFQEIEQSIRQHFTDVERADSIKDIPLIHAALILCESQHSFAEMIKIMEGYKEAHDFFIHAAGTNSIVGSIDKNTTGNFIMIA